MQLLKIEQSIHHSFIFTLVLFHLPWMDMLMLQMRQNSFLYICETDKILELEILLLKQRVCKYEKTVCCSVGGRECMY